MCRVFRFTDIEDVIKKSKDNKYKPTSKRPGPYDNIRTLSDTPSGMEPIFDPNYKRKIRTK